MRRFHSCWTIAPELSRRVVISLESRFNYLTSFQVTSPTIKESRDLSITFSFFFKTIFFKEVGFLVFGTAKIFSFRTKYSWRQILNSLTHAILPSWDIFEELLLTVGRFFIGLGVVCITYNQTSSHLIAW